MSLIQAWVKIKGSTRKAPKTQSRLTATWLLPTLSSSTTSFRTQTSIWSIESTSRWRSDPWCTSCASIYTHTFWKVCSNKAKKKGKKLSSNRRRIKRRTLSRRKKSMSRPSLWMSEVRSMMTGWLTRLALINITVLAMRLPVLPRQLWRGYWIWADETRRASYLSACWSWTWLLLKE